MTWAGKPVNMPEMIEYLADVSPIGTEISIGIQKGNRVIATAVKLVPYYESFRSLIISIFVGLTVFAVGVFTLLTRPQDVAARALRLWDFREQGAGGNDHLLHVDDTHSCLATAKQSGGLARRHRTSSLLSGKPEPAFIHRQFPLANLRFSSRMVIFWFWLIMLPIRYLPHRSCNRLFATKLQYEPEAVARTSATIRKFS